MSRSEVMLRPVIHRRQGFGRRHVGLGLAHSANGQLGLCQVVPPLRPGFLEGAPDETLKALVRQVAEDLHFRQTRSPGHELVNGPRHMRQRRDLAS